MLITIERNRAGPYLEANPVNDQRMSIIRFSKKLRFPAKRAIKIFFFRVTQEGLEFQILSKYFFIYHIVE